MPSCLVGLKNRSANCAASVIDQSGSVTESDVEAATAVSNFWSDFWHRARARQPRFQWSGLLPCLLGCLPFKIVNGTPPSASLLQSTARGGSWHVVAVTGPDVRVAREIGFFASAGFLSYFPCSVLVGCNLLKFLGNFLESRIISLVKPGKNCWPLPLVLTICVLSPCWVVGIAFGL